jgi:hypothetical protein
VTVSRAKLTELVDELEGPRGEAALVLGVARAAATNWGAAAWLLERRWPERWGLGRRARVEIADHDDPAA